MSGTTLCTGGMISATGTATADWSDAEKAQIRSALGIDGAKTDIDDSEISTKIATHDQNIKALMYSEY